jgi:hypothetical protein
LKYFRELSASCTTGTRQAEERILTESILQIKVDIVDGYRRMWFDGRRLLGSKSGMPLTSVSGPTIMHLTVCKRKGTGSINKIVDALHLSSLKADF